ncbi:MAG: hypothetical protein ABSF87_13730 [Xanthobacteraceae bacterium]|jgi:hypothetical protein
MTSKPIADAVEEVAKRLGISIGAAKVKLLDPLHAGCIRACWRGHYSQPWRPMTRAQWEGADIDVASNVVILASGERMGRVDLEENDYQAWLHEQKGSIDLIRRKTTTAANSRRQNKRDRAKAAIAALWPRGIPAEAALPNALLCAKVSEWIKSDCKNRNVPFVDISSDTIERAAGRKI